jgi:hypothetical protein
MSPEYESFLRSYGIFFCVKTGFELLKISYAMLYERLDGSRNENESKTQLHTNRSDETR